METPSTKQGVWSKTHVQKIRAGIRHRLWSLPASDEAHSHTYDWTSSPLWASSSSLQFSFSSSSLVTFTSCVSWQVQAAITGSPAVNLLHILLLRRRLCHDPWEWRPTPSVTYQHNVCFVWATPSEVFSMHSSGPCGRRGESLAAGDKLITTPFSRTPLHSHPSTTTKKKKWCNEAPALHLSAQHPLVSQSHVHTFSLFNVYSYLTGPRSQFWRLFCLFHNVPFFFYKKL